MTTEAKVGTFVLACASILTATLIALITPELRSGLVPYHTYLRYAGGLAPGAEVMFGGIRVGRISKVGPDTSDPTRIAISLELKPETPVNEKSVAKIGSVGLMSEPALLISTGSNLAPRIKAGNAIPSEEAVTLDEIAGKMALVAANANTLITQVQGELGDISGDARKLLANLNSVTGPPNQKRIKIALDQVDGLLADERPKLNRISDQLLGLSQHADEVVQKMGPFVDHVDGTVSDLREPLRVDTVELENTLREAKGVLASMQVLLQANDYKIDDTVENLRVTTENLNQLTNSIKQRPWSLVRIRQPKDRQVP